MAVAAGVLPLVALATGPILARALGPDARGYLSAILAAITLVPYLLTMGLSDAASYLVAARKQHPTAVTIALGSAGALAGAVGAVGIFFLAPVLMAGYEPGVVLLQLLALTLVPEIAFSAITGARTGEGRYDLLIAERWIAGLGRLAILVALLVTGTLTIATAAWATVGILLVAQLALLVGLSRPRVGLRKLRDLVRAGYSYGLRAWGGELSATLVARIDQVVLLPLAGAAQLGYYAIAVSLAEIPKMLVGDLRGLLLSEVSARRDPHTAAAACRTAVLAVLVPIGGLMAVTPVLLPLLFGEDFTPSVPMAEVLLIAALPASANLALAASVSALGRPGLQSLASVVSLVAVLVGIFVLVPRAGALGAAWAVLVAQLIGTAVLCAIFRSTTGLPVHRLIIPRPSDARQLVTRLRPRG